MPLFARRSRGASSRTVTVYPGDTLWSLAFAYGCTVDELVRANGGISPRSVRPGTKLRLPGGAEDAGPWNRFDDGHEQRRAYRDDSAQRRGGVPVLRVVIALAAGVAVGALRFAPGPVGDGTRAALDKAAAAADSAAKAVVPAAEVAVRRARPVVQAAMNKLGAGLQALGRATSHAIIEVLGGTSGRMTGSVKDAAAGLSESSRARVELAQAQALSAAAEAARASLERELAAALAAVEALTQTESAQRALAESQAARSRELELRLDAVRLAAAASAEAGASCGAE